MTTPRDILVKARELIADPAHWTKGEFGRDAHGNGIVPWLEGRKPVCYCSLGAILTVGDSGDEAARVLEKHMRDSITRFNDDPKTTHADVLAAFDRAIADAA